MKFKLGVWLGNRRREKKKRCPHFWIDYGKRRADGLTSKEACLICGKVQKRETPA